MVPWQKELLILQMMFLVVTEMQGWNFGPPALTIQENIYSLGMATATGNCHPCFTKRSIHATLWYVTICITILLKISQTSGL